MIGIDLVLIDEFKKRMQVVDKSSVFIESELSQNTTIESLAGIFAAKEAFFKALGKKEHWLDVWIEKEKSGKPVLYSNLLNNDEQVEISITHAGNFAIAVVVKQ